VPKNKQNGEVAGNSIASQAAFDRQLQRMGVTMLKFEAALESLTEQDILVEGLNVKLATGGRPDTMIVVRATVGSGRIVCFCSGETLVDAVQNFVGRYQSGTIVWKDDQYAR